MTSPPQSESLPQPQSAWNQARETWLATNLEMPNGSQGRRQGLLGRTELPSGSGLWISPCEAVHTFGMRFAIDIVFLDTRNRICKLRQNVVPNRIAVCLRGSSVLELPAGAIAQSGSHVGDNVVFHNICVHPCSSAAGL